MVDGHGRGSRPRGGADPRPAEFIARLRELEIPYLVLINNSIYTARDLAARLRNSGIELPEERIWTSALATARFLEDQRPGGSAYVIGEAGLTTALRSAGYTLTERNPEYVVLGETRTYSFERITQAIRLIAGGARFIATNPDATGPTLNGPLPATCSVAALISRATGVEPYFVGKPNPLMMRSALNAIDAHSETTAMIGDRMESVPRSGRRGGSAMMTFRPPLPARWRSADATWSAPMTRRPSARSSTPGSAPRPPTVTRPLQTG